MPYYRYVLADEPQDFELLALAQREAVRARGVLLGETPNLPVLPRVMLFRETSAERADFESTQVGGYWNAKYGIGIRDCQPAAAVAHLTWHEVRHWHQWATNGGGPTSVAREREAERFARRHCSGCALCLGDLEALARGSAEGYTTHLRSAAARAQKANTTRRRLTMGATITEPPADQTLGDILAFRAGLLEYLPEVREVYAEAVQQGFSDFSRQLSELLTECEKYLYNVDPYRTATHRCREWQREIWAMLVDAEANAGELVAVTS